MSKVETITLKTLEEHNKKHTQIWKDSSLTIKRTPGQLEFRCKEFTWREFDSNTPRPNEISCPDCGTELADTDPSNLLLSDPPQFAIHCPVCEFKGYRLA